MNRPLSLAAALAILMFCILVAALFGGARINITKSFPPGIYWVVEKVPEKGDLVLFCPPEGEMFELAMSRGYLSSGNCPSGSMRMLKRLSAVAGDEVMFRREGVLINNQPQAKSRWLAHDPDGRNMPQPRVSHVRLSQGEVLMLSDYSRLSFDGRYFGPISASLLGEVVEPWLVWTAVEP